MRHVAAHELELGKANDETQAGSDPPEPDPTDDSATIDDGTSPAAASGNVVAPGEGVVFTTLGDVMMEVPTSTPIQHAFEPGVAGARDRVVIRHFVDTAGDVAMSFEFEYTEGEAEFGVVEVGYLGVTLDGEEFVAAEGEVAVEVMPDDTLSITFAKLEFRSAQPGDDDALRVIGDGSGLVVGKVESSCPAVDEANVDPVVLPDDAGAEAPTDGIDEVWVEAFCGAGR